MSAWSKKIIWENSAKNIQVSCFTRKLNLQTPSTGFPLLVKFMLESLKDPMRSRWREFFWSLVYLEAGHAKWGRLESIQKKENKLKQLGKENKQESMTTIFDIGHIWRVSLNILVITIKFRNFYTASLLLTRIFLAQWLNLRGQI